MAYTRLQLTDKVRENLHDWGNRDRITEALDASSTTMTVNDYEKFGDGVWYEIENEILQGLNDPTTSTVSVHARGERGSTAASHADETSIYIGRKWWLYI